MRQLFVQCLSRRTAQRRAPWAARIVKVCGGFMCFESQTDSQAWKQQV